MKNGKTNPLQIHIPDNLTDLATEKEVINLLYEKAVTKREYFLSKTCAFQKKYNMDFSELQALIKKEENENFEIWDDFIVWEGYFELLKQWDEKCMELKKCMK